MAYVELGSYSCRLPWPGRPGEWVQPAVGSLSTPEESGWVVRVGLLMPKATEGLFELDARFRSRPVQPQGWRWSRRASRTSESIQRPAPIQPQVPKPPRCASTPPRLIELAPSGTSRIGGIFLVYRASAITRGGAVRVECAADGDRTRQVLPQDGSRRRHAVQVCKHRWFDVQTARGPNGGTSARWLTVRPEGSGPA